MFAFFQLSDVIRCHGLPMSCGLLLDFPSVLGRLAQANAGRMDAEVGGCVKIICKQMRFG